MYRKGNGHVTGPLRDQHLQGSGASSSVLCRSRRLGWKTELHSKTARHAAFFTALNAINHSPGLETNVRIILSHYNKLDRLNKVMNLRQGQLNIQIAE